MRPAPFVGRETQLAALRSALQAAEFGERVVALVAGEPGIGKTRLVHEVTHQVGSPVLWASCWAGEGAPPYWPWVQVLRQMTGSAGTRLAMLGTYRYSDLDEGSALACGLSDLVRDGLHIVLGGLSGQEVAGLLDALLGERADRAAVPRLHRLSGGNPFFLREMAYLLDSEGTPALSRDDVHVAVPASVRAVVARRLDRLSASTRETLRVAAVLGSEPDPLVSGR